MYKQAYDEIQGYLMEGRYTISRLRLLTGSPEAVQVQVENLEVLIFGMFNRFNIIHNNSDLRQTF